LPTSLKEKQKNQNANFKTFLIFLSKLSKKDCKSACCRAALFLRIPGEYFNKALTPALTLQYKVSQKNFIQTKINVIVEAVGT
jgi:hypothetical protein